MSVSPRLMTSQVTVEPMLLSRVAQAEPSLIEQAGGWPAILLTIWLGVAAGLFAARMLAFRRERAAILDDSYELDWLGNVRLMQSSAVSGPLSR